MGCRGGGMPPDVSLTPEKPAAEATDSTDAEKSGLLVESHSHVEPRARLLAALRRVPFSPYFWANVVYLFYTCQALAVDYCSVSLHPPVFGWAPAPWAAPGEPTGVPSTDTLGPAPPAPSSASLVWRLVTAPECAESGDSPVYKQYVLLASVHLVNAFQYLYLWRPWFRENAARHSRRFLAGVLLPELLNVLEASLYLHSATRYMAVQKEPACVASDDNPQWYKCADLLRMHATETFASLIEMAASFCWLWSWLATHERGPGRGMTLWDLDCHSSFLLILGSAIYVMYNFQILAYPERYGSNLLYHGADIIYFVGAVLYSAASLRDVDWCVCPPTAAAPNVSFTS
jgi:hypothetical protein